MSSGWMSRLKILVVLQNDQEVRTLQQELEYLGHCVQHCRDLGEALRVLRNWQPDLVLTEEGLGHEQPDAGLRLAEYCRAIEDRINGWPGTRAVILISFPDWGRFQRARQTGAHVIVKGANFEAVVRYVQTIADGVVTDRMLGPVLVGIHGFQGSIPNPNCDSCQWISARVSYGSSCADLEHLTPVRTALLNILLFRRRGQSLNTIADVSCECPFLTRILRGHALRESAVKMEITRLRHDLGKALSAIGAPYSGEHFLPFVSYGVERYRLEGNWRLLHVPAELPRYVG